MAGSRDSAPEVPVFLLVSPPGAIPPAPGPPSAWGFRRSRLPLGLRGHAAAKLANSNGPGCAVCAMRVCFLPALCSGFSCAGGFLFGAPGVRLPYRGVGLFGRFAFGFELKAE